MATTTNELDVWFLQVPVVEVGGDPDFGTWDLLAPVVDQDGSTVASTRRRAAEF